MPETPSAPSDAVRWLEWSGAAFARAQAEQKPILLALVTSWCAGCRDMQRTTYADPAVAATINAQFVPIRVDADQRPDINDRYNLGGWPTTAFLTPAGEILAGGTYIAPDPLSLMLAQVVEAFRTRRDEIEAESAVVFERRAAARTPAARGAPDAAAVDWLCDRLLERFDQTHGGFDVNPKFPHVAAVTLALERYRDSSDERFLRLVTTTLDAMSLGGLYDSLEGGFFRCATGGDWSRPRTEKLLDDNAALLRLYLDASVLLDHPSYRDDAIHILRYVQGTLADSLNAGFHGSQRADDSYYRLETMADRRARPEPALDRTLYVDWNCDMIVAYLRAADLLGDSSLGDFAIRSLERLLLAAYRPGAGVAHCVREGTSVRGLLGDQIHAAAALIWAHVASSAGRLPYSMLAAELVQYAIRTMWDEEAGGFYDRAAGESDANGLLSQRLKPFVANCDAAVVLARLGAITGDDGWRARAVQTLAALAQEYQRHDLGGAAYGLAIREVVHGHLPLGLQLSPVDWRLHELDDD